jgi:hypothetical protein
MSTFEELQQRAAKKGIGMYKMGDKYFAGENGKDNQFMFGNLDDLEHFIATHGNQHVHNYVSTYAGWKCSICGKDKVPFASERKQSDPAKTEAKRMLKKKFSARYKRVFRDAFNNPSQYSHINLSDTASNPASDDYRNAAVAGVVKRRRLIAEGKGQFINSESELNELIE